MMVRLSTDERPLPIWPFLVFCAPLAFWYALSDIHKYHSVDTIVPIMLSVYRWTPTFWASNHPGMLIPLLASPIKDLLWNMIVQSALGAWFGMGAFFLLTRYVLRNRAYPIVASFSLAAFLGLAPEFYQFDLFVNSHHSTWLFLGLAALILVEQHESGPASLPRRLIAFVLLTLAHWVSVATVIGIGGLALGRALVTSRPKASGISPDPSGPRGLLARFARTEFGVALRVLAPATLLGWLSLRFTPTIHVVPSNSSPLSDWAVCCMVFAQNTLKFLSETGGSGWLFTLILAGGIALALLRLPMVRRQSALGWEAAACLALAALGYWGFMGTRMYIRSFNLHHRYLEPAVFFAQAALISTCAAPITLAMRPRLRRALLAVGLVCILLSLSLRIGQPSIDRVRGALDRSFGATTPDILESGATHVLGNFNYAWPAAFHANLTLQSRGEDRVVWGITSFSRPVKRYWGPLLGRPDCRIAVPIWSETEADPLADAHIQYMIPRFRLPQLSVVDRRATVWILEPSTNNGLSRVDREKLLKR